MTPRKPVVELLDPVVVECLKRMTPQQRLEQGFRIWESAVVIVRGAVRQQHPEYTDEEVQRETANRLSHGATEDARRAQAARAHAEGG